MNLCGEVEGDNFGIFSSWWRVRMAVVGWGSYVPTHHWILLSARLSHKRRSCTSTSRGGILIMIMITLFANRHLCRNTRSRKRLGRRAGTLSAAKIVIYDFIKTGRAAATQGTKHFPPEPEPTHRHPANGQIHICNIN